MPVTTTSVREAIMALLRTVDGTGNYTLNLSANVLPGKYDRPPSVTPMACVWTIQVDETIGPVASSWRQTGSFGILLWGVPRPKDPGARQDAAEDLLDNARRALRSSPRLDGQVTNFEVSASPWEDQQTPDKTTYPRALLVVSATWREA